jgi:DNA-binding GntR family transcriptional regulator
MDNQPPPAGQRAPTGAEVAEWIRQRIRRGRYAPGQRLVEVDIIRQTGASRFKVREAFQRLEGEGLVLTEEFRGASVRSASIDEVRQIYRARIALEGICAADFARHATPGQIDRLEGLQAELDACVAENAPERFGRLNLEWHALLVEGARNDVIRQLLERLNVPIHRLLFESFYSPNRLKNANADHHRVMAAIKAGDPAGAEAAMRDHVAAGFATLANISDEFFG